MMKQSEQCCNNCYYAVSNSKRLECHRYPPGWPPRRCGGFLFVEIHSTNWCGEWRDSEGVRQQAHGTLAAAMRRGH